MALILILDRDNSHANPTKDQAGCFKLGDVVDVYEDDRHDGNLVANPIAAPFYLIRVIGVTVAQVRKTTEPELSAVVEGLIVRKRKWRLDLAGLPTNVRNQLLANRYLEVTVQQARNYIRNKITGEGL